MIHCFAHKNAIQSWNVFLCHFVKSDERRLPWCHTWLNKLNKTIYHIKKLIKQHRQRSVVCTVNRL